MAPATKTNNPLILRAGTSDSEDDLAGVEDSLANTSVLKTSTTMPPRKQTNTAATKRKAAPKTQKRQALKDRTNIQAGSDTEDVDDLEEDGGKPKAKRAKTTAARKQTGTRNTGATSKAKGAKALSIIPETQPDPEDVSRSFEVDPDGMDVTAVPTPPQVPRFFQRARSASVQPLQPRASARSASAQPLQPRPSARSVSAQPGYPPPRERSGSVSDTARERRGNDPELRRKLLEKEKQYEDLKLKYEALQEIGQNHEQTQFEKLKRAADQKAKDQDAVIVALKKELAEARKASTSSSEVTDLKRQVNTLTTSNELLTNDATNLKTTLQVTQNEVKSLEAKLVASRQQLSQSATAESNNKAPGAATTRQDLSKSVGSNATDTQKEFKMKENLYSDLTGLIIRGVKRKEGEDEYDCIQTGRNGSKSSSSPCNQSRPFTDLFLTSLTLPSVHRKRQQHLEPQDSLRPHVRGSGVRVRAAAGRRQRSRSDGVVARVSCRGDLFPEESSGEVLYEGFG